MRLYFERHGPGHDPRSRERLHEDSRLNPAIRLPYEAVARMASVAAALTPVGGGKLRRAIAARRGALAHIVAWADRHRDPGRPLIWLHAPSVGEGLMAAPVIDRLRARVAGLQVAYTFFSPSAEAFARQLPVDVAGYLPFDTGAAAATLLDALRPAALAFSKLDVWPVLAETAAARGVPTVLTSAAIAPGSGRLAWVARVALHDAYSGLAAAGASDADTAARLERLGVKADRIVITGDTRYDQAWARARAGASNADLVAQLRSSRPTLVAGSTWPSDETVLAPAWQALRAAVPQARLIVAAHEPGAAHTAAARRTFSGLGHAVSTLDEPLDATDVVIVDRVGVLADVYAAGTVAYVGGGFHAAGLHSVVEPAAHGLPVLFGPRHAGSRDAMALIGAGGGFAANDAGSLAKQLTRLLGDRGAARTAGGRARQVVESGLGAADRTTDLVLSVMRR